MSEHDLDRLLANLHQELSSIHSVDAETRARLQQLAAQLKPIVEGGTGKLEPAQHHGLRAALTDAMARLEVSHPQAAATIARVMDTLAFYNL